MRIVFMGTPNFAVPTLDRLIKSSHEVVAVISQPDRPVGRGYAVKPTPVKECAQEHNVPVYQPEKIRSSDFLAQLATLKPDLIVVAAYGKILPKEILELPKFGCINVHASLLPKYRGAAPVQWAIINGERKTGVTIMKMDAGMDTGEIIEQRGVDILDDDDSLSLGQMLSVVGAEALVDVVDAIESTGHILSTPQEDAEASYAPKLKKEDGHIDWHQDAETIICRVMGLKPWPGAYAMHEKGPFKIWRAISFYPEEAQSFLKKEQKPGEIIAHIGDRGPVVRTLNGCLCITEIQPPNRKSMSGQDAINGGYVPIGMVFS